MVHACKKRFETQSEFERHVLVNFPVKNQEADGETNRGGTDWIVTGIGIEGVSNSAEAPAGTWHPLQIFSTRSGDDENGEWDIKEETNADDITAGNGKKYDLSWSHKQDKYQNSISSRETQHMNDISSTGLNEIPATSPAPHDDNEIKQAGNINVLSFCIVSL